MPRDWESAYREAVLETDLVKVLGKIDSARTTLCACLLELGVSGEHVAERQRLMDALSTLDLIKRVELKVSA
jgi:hypothetical protein